MKVLVACEESQTVCKAFREMGHIAFSCDLQSCSGGKPEWHIQRDCISFINDSLSEWDLIIAHPPCTYLSKVSSVALSLGKHTFAQVMEAKKFFMFFYNLPGRVCIENPVPMALAGLPPYTQTVQPYQFGDNWTKLTCLWLKNLPPLISNCYAPYGYSRNCCPSWVYHKFGSKARSKTFPGIARAMATQWNFD